jgi:NADP-dependent 3-hydroxy acid dehydrogenase YdfG
MSKVWFVTGSASGLGRNIAEAVLESGDRLVATARDPHRLEDLVKKFGDQKYTRLPLTLPTKKRPLPPWVSRWTSSDVWTLL